MTGALVRDALMSGVVQTDDLAGKCQSGTPGAAVFAMSCIYDMKLHCLHAPWKIWHAGVGVQLPSMRGRCNLRLSRACCIRGRRHAGHGEGDGARPVLVASAAAPAGAVSGRSHVHQLS